MYMLTCSDLKFLATVNEGYHMQYTNLNEYTYVCRWITTIPTQIMYVHMFECIIFHKECHILLCKYVYS